MQNDKDPIHVGENELTWVPARGEYMRQRGLWVPKKELFRSWMVVSREYESGATVLVYHRLDHEYWEREVPTG